MKKTRGFETVENKFRKHGELSIQLPIRGDGGSAGYDFFSNETITLEPRDKHLFWTDVKAYMLADEVLEVYIRSSLGVKHLLALANGTGIIDSSYYGNPGNDGNIGICLVNWGSEPVVIEKGERIAQGIFTNYLVADDDQVLHQQREGGFGSSNR